MADEEIHVRPRRDEVALIHVPGGGPVTVHTVDGPRRVTAQLPGDALTALVPGDRAHLWYGAWSARYARLEAVSNGRHADDRPVWEDAVRCVRKGGIVYVQHELTEYYGRKAWRAKEVRFHINRPAFRVAFNRIGNVAAPDLVTSTLSAQPEVLTEGLRSEIAAHARPHLRGEVDVKAHPDTGVGYLLDDGVPAGVFRLTEFDPTGATAKKMRSALAA